MKKKLLLIVAVLMLVMLTSCFLPENVELGYDITVNFYVDGQLYKTENIAANSKMREPDAPHKENYIFDGWYTDGLVNKKYDFYDGFLTSTNLYAKYILDAESVVNTMTTDIMKSVVMITNKCYNYGPFGIEKDGFVSQGSGVVIDISGGYCYVLTNAHVIDMEGEYDGQDIVVEDLRGIQYQAKIYKNKNIEDSAVSKEYDLAVIYFSYVNNGIIEEIKIAEDPKVNDYVVALGAPEGQKNSITIGQTMSYSKLSQNSDGEISKVKFDIIVHDAPINHGSSGGPLVDPKGQLVGLNFAGNNEGAYGCAIPMSRILEFLNKYVYVK